MSLRPNLLISIGALAFFSAASGAFAQTVNVDRADLARPAVGSGVTPTGDMQAIPSSPNDADLGEQQILKRSEGYKAFSFSAALPAYWTSNVALSNRGEMSDFLFAPVVALAYQPRLANNLYGVIGVREQLFYYTDFDEFNFGSFDVDAGLIYILPSFHNMILRAEFLYTRLTQKDTFDDFFSDYSIFLGAEVPFKIGRAQQISLGADTKISIDANPERPRRNEYEVYLGYSAAVTRQFSIDAVGRVVVRTYQLTDRVDVSEVFSASANFRVTEWFTASAISTLAANQSNHGVFDYEVADLGGLLSLNLRF